MPASARSTRASRNAGKAKQRRTVVADLASQSHYPDSDPSRKLPDNAARTIRTRTIVIDCFRRGLSMQAAADEAEVARSSIYKWIREDPVFAEEVEMAREGGTDLLEDEAARRGGRGYRRAVYHQGAVVGYERMYSDNLLIRTLEARRPESWKRNASVDVNATVAGVVQHQHAHVHLTLEQLRERAAERGLPLEIFEK